MTTTHPSPLVEGPSAAYGWQQWQTQDRTNRLVDRAMACGTEVNTEKNKIMTNRTNNFSTDIYLNNQELLEVTGFKYLGKALCKDGICLAEVHIRIASAMAAMARINRIWWCNTISFASKVKLFNFLVTSILLYGCETGTLPAG